MFLFPKVDMQLWNAFLPRFPVIPLLGMHVGSPSFPQSQFHASLCWWIFGIFGNRMRILGNKNCSIKSHVGNSIRITSIASLGKFHWVGGHGVPHGSAWSCFPSSKQLDLVLGMPFPGITSAFPGDLPRWRTRIIPTKSNSPSRIHFPAQFPALPLFPAFHGMWEWGTSQDPSRGEVGPECARPDHHDHFP